MFLCVKELYAGPEAIVHWLDHFQLEKDQDTEQSSQYTVYSNRGI